MSRPTLHVFDSNLRNAAGHHLGQHMALLKLCARKGFTMVSYVPPCDDTLCVNSPVLLTRFFSAPTSRAVTGQYYVDFGVTNHQYYKDLTGFDLTRLGPGDLLFFTSISANNAIGLGLWLRDVGPNLEHPVGIYAVVSSEVDDTLARRVARGGVELSADTFRSLDNEVEPNDVKRSAYRFLFQQIPAKSMDRFKVFYEEPFPSRAFLGLSPSPRLCFIHLHSMYFGEDDESSRDVAEGPLRIAFLGSGGVGQREKGADLLSGIAAVLADARDGWEMVAQLAPSGGAAPPANETFGSQVQLLEGVLAPQEFTRVLEGSDLVLLPYGPRYAHFMSGIFDDCLFLGKPAVVPSWSKMARWMEFHGLLCPTFDEWSVESISAALADTMDCLGTYRESFGEARRIVRANWEKGNPVTALAGTRG